tara:strand:+ start:173 stop:469 length:297 start_codon:yes stop_codon:yes gene_type:complete
VISVKSFIIFGEMMNQQYGIIKQIARVENPIKFRINLRSKSYNAGFTNLIINKEAYGKDIISPANITVPHRILNHLSGEYTVNSEISNSNEDIQVEII